jgi:ubiquinone/menaquinone biosynthesis C-methylase UbiE
MLARRLEPEVMDSPEDADAYDAMDHSAVNSLFVDDLLAVFPAPRDVLDLGTGNARIPLELCRRVGTCRVMAADKSRAMLQLARYLIEIAGLRERVQLDHCDAKKMLYRNGMFDLVMCNGTLHHFADPAVVLGESWRVTASGGGVFFRDLLRPDDEVALESLVTTYAGDATPHQQQMFRDSLSASLTLDELRAAVTDLGLDPATVQVTSDRHWTWSAHKS